MLSNVVPTRALRHITSRHNPDIARYREAARGEAPDHLLLDGPHLVADALAAGVALDSVTILSTAIDRPDIRALVAKIEATGVEVVSTTPQVMAVVSPVRSSSAIVALARRPALDASRVYAGADPFVLIAADIQDPGNLGAIIRAAEAGRATGVIAAGACADPLGWKALRGSSGSALRLPIGTSATAASAAADARRHGCRASGPAATAASAAADARRHGCRAIATVPRGGRSLYDVDLRGAAAVLIGGEGPGLDPSLVEQADERLTIPMRAPVESLNAAVAAAIVVYEALRQRT